MDLSRKLSDDEIVTPSKRFLSEDEKNFSFGNINNSANIKIATKGERGFEFIFVLSSLMAIAFREREICIEAGILPVII